MDKSNGKDKVVLVVEDSPTQALHMETLLNHEGLKVVLANNGRVGLDLAHEFLPDMIVLDLQMPEMNGVQVCRALKQSAETAHIPVIVLTSHDEQDTVIQVLELGAVDYIPKDIFADAVLLETLKEMGVIV